MNVWKKSKAKNYWIKRNDYSYVVMNSKVDSGLTLMVQSMNDNGSTRFKKLDSNNMVDAVMEATQYIKSRMESRSA